MALSSIKKKGREEFDREFADSRYAQARAKQLKAFLEKQMDIEFEAGRKIPHKTANGYCCACDYDMAVMAEKIKKTAKLLKIGERIR